MRAKIINTDPAVNLTWAAMDENNRKTSRANLRRKGVASYLRNETLPYLGIAGAHRMLPIINPDDIDWKYMQV